MQRMIGLLVACIFGCALENPTAYPGGSLPDAAADVVLATDAAVHDVQVPQDVSNMDAVTSDTGIDAATDVLITDVVDADSVDVDAAADASTSDVALDLGVDTGVDVVTSQDVPRDTVVVDVGILDVGVLDSGADTGVDTGVDVGVDVGVDSGPPPDVQPSFTRTVDARFQNRAYIEAVPLPDGGAAWVEATGASSAADTISGNDVGASVLMNGRVRVDRQLVRFYALTEVCDPLYADVVLRFDGYAPLSPTTEFSVYTASLRTDTPIDVSGYNLARWLPGGGSISAFEFERPRRGERTVRISSVQLTSGELRVGIRAEHDSPTRAPPEATVNPRAALVTAVRATIACR